MCSAISAMMVSMDPPPFLHPFKLCNDFVNTKIMLPCSYLSSRTCHSFAHSHQPLARASFPSLALKLRSRVLHTVDSNPLRPSLPAGHSRTSPLFPLRHLLHQVQLTRNRVCRLHSLLRLVQVDKLGF